MAYDRVVDSSELDAGMTATANAIREKTGSTDPIMWDASNGFKTAVEGIETGGVSEQEIIYAIQTGTFPSGDLVLYDEVFSYVSYAFSHNEAITSVSLPNCVKTTGINGGVYPFLNCKNIKTIYAPVLEEITYKTFCNLTGLTELYVPKLKKISSDQAIENTACKRFEFPSLESTVNNALRMNYVLEEVDIWTSPNIGTRTFDSCRMLKTVIIRGDKVATLSGINAFNGTPFASGGTGGTVYVPSALISEYQQATNWSTLYAAGTCNFVAIEGSEYE